MIHENRAVGLTSAEVAGTSAVSFLAFAILFAYFTDWAGLTIAPTAVLGLSLTATLVLLAWLRRQLVEGGRELAAFAGVAGVVLSWLLWLSWPDLLPLGGGSDLTHHLQLVDFLDRHWRLVHDASVEAYLGEMAHYTPGAHLLASLAGQWIGTDGFHTIYPVVALSVALKAGFVFLIALRVLGGEVWLKPDAPTATLPFALIVVALLFLPRAFFVESFARNSYIAQVVSEMFAVVMWWALVVWDERPSTAVMVLFATAGVGVFLAWPVWIGPPLVLLAVIVITRSDLSFAEKRRALMLGALPIVIVALVHSIGRLGWLRIASTDADMPIPVWRDFSGWFLALAAAGAIAVSVSRRGRTTALLIVTIALQAAALFAAAKANGAKVPYMAIKMAYFAIHPLAVLGALAVAFAWRAAVRVAGRSRWSNRLAWTLAIVVIGIVGLQMVRAPLQKATVSEPLYLAGRWARANVEPACVDYIVGDDDTAYWLHLAVLGNPRMSSRTADDSTYMTRDAIIRWINPGGLPYAVADLAIIPKDVLASTDELARFGPAVVIKRRGPSSCSP